MYYMYYIKIFFLLIIINKPIITRNYLFHMQVNYLIIKYYEKKNAFFNLTVNL
jgi:hypothetical protein